MQTVYGGYMGKKRLQKYLHLAFTQSIFELPFISHMHAAITI